MPHLLSRFSWAGRSYSYGRLSIDALLAVKTDHKSQRNTAGLTVRKRVGWSPREVVGTLDWVEKPLHTLPIVAHWVRQLNQHRPVESATEEGM